MEPLRSPLKQLQLLTVLSYFLILTPATADEDHTDEKNTYSDHLSGNWGGLRDTLASNGFDWEVLYKNDWLQVDNGQTRGSRMHGNLDIKLKLDFEKISQWADWQGLVYLLNDHGGKPNLRLANTYMGISNTETNTNTTKLYMAWLQKEFLEKQASLLFGLLDYNSEFYVTESSGVFLHPTYGTGAEIAQSGFNGPSVFPTTGLAVRLRYEPTPSYYWQGAIWEGEPGDSTNGHGTQIERQRGEGTLQTMELGWRPFVAGKNTSWRGKYALGTWRYTAKFDDLSDTDEAENLIKKRSRGTYFLAEQTIFRQHPDTPQGLDVFLRYGIDPSATRRLSYHLDFGMVYQGIMASRPEDTLGIAYAKGHAHAKYRAAIAASGGTPAASEEALEVTYSYLARPGLRIQPNWQYIRHPDMDAARPAVKVLGVRVQLNF